MYVMPSMLSLAFPTGQEEKWTSPAHKKVAECALLCNPRINTRQLLIDNAAIINAIPMDEIKKVTFADLFAKDVMVSN